MLQCGLRKRRDALGVVLGTSQYRVRPLKEHPYLKGIFDGLTTTS